MDKTFLPITLTVALMASHQAFNNILECAHLSRRAFVRSDTDVGYERLDLNLPKHSLFVLVHPKLKGLVLA